MHRLIKYLKPFVSSIILVFLLLFAQAALDLSLPGFMSSIVDIGISENGIENAVPKVIRKEQLEKLLFIVQSESDRELILNNYNLVEKNLLFREPNAAILKDFPKLNDFDFYVLNTSDKKVIEKMDNILKKPTGIMATIIKENESLFLEDLEYFKNNYKNNDDLTEDQLNTILKSGYIFIRTEYIDLGADISKMQTKFIVNTGLKMLLITLLSVVIVGFVAFFASRTAAGVGRDLRNELFSKVVSFSSAEFNEFSTASLITRTTNDVQQIQTVVVLLLRMVIFAPILGIGGIIKVLQTSSQMSVIVLVSVAFIMAFVALLFVFAMPKFKKSQVLVDNMNLVLREQLTGILVIRAFNTQSHEEDKFDEVNTDLRKTNLFVSRLMTSMMPAMSLVMNITGVAILWFGAINVDKNFIMTGDIIKFIQYSTQIIMSFLMLSMVSILLPRASVSANRIIDVLDSENSILDPEQPVKTTENKKGLIEFKNVSFTYQDAEEKILENISFVAKPGQTTAFIGSTGSGKSTLVNLIPRFYDVVGGEVLVEGTNVKDMELDYLRDKIGFIPQKALLFKGTIESNLKFGDIVATDEEMEKAAKISQSYDFIMEKEKKYDEPISQGGQNVSGGQRQRLAIARAIAKKPNIFIFDDSFSALDYSTDRKLRNDIKTELGDKTILIVAQRISTIKDAEQIIVLDEGKIVGMGSHSELLKFCDVYKQIAMSQLSKEELEYE